MSASLTGNDLTFAQLYKVALHNEIVELAPAAVNRMNASRAVVERLLASGATEYDINSGFGKLASVRISAEQVRQLQVNRVRSPASGVGEPLSETETRAMMLLRANALAKGLSGVRPVVVETLIKMLNARVHPVIPSQGSVGASGDLAPLAHLAHVVIGEGRALYRGEALAGGEAMNRAGIPPLVLEAKEGLSLLNGTQGMLALLSLALYEADILADSADVAAALSLDALRGSPGAFDARIMHARAYPGAATTARNLAHLNEGSQIPESHRAVEKDPRVQDAYSLRCTPQVHGAVRDALAHAREVVEIESGSATDNPLVFADTGEVLSGGNFHGAPLALAFDYAAMALTDLMSITERRIDRLVNPDANDDLPPFLTSHPGSASGFMMLQIVAAALLSEAKVLAHPASIDNVPTDGGKEDHDSMGFTAAIKLRSIVDNAELITAIELITAAEGLQYRAPLQPGRGVKQAYNIVRVHVPRLTADRAMSHEIQEIAEAIRNGEFDSAG